jgi:hypothetical protein
VSCLSFGYHLNKSEFHSQNYNPDISTFSAIRSSATDLQVAASNMANGIRSDIVTPQHIGGSGFISGRYKSEQKKYWTPHYALPYAAIVVIEI